MKKITISAIFVCTIVFLMFFSTGCTNNDIKNNNSSGLKTSNDLGYYRVNILDSRVTKDSFNKNIIIIRYKYSNINDDIATSFASAFESEAFQDNIKLKESYSLPESAKYKNDIRYEKINKGETIELEIAYELINNKSSVEINVKEIFSFNYNVLKKVFKL